MAENSLKQKITSVIDNVKYYWNDATKGRFMSFKEIAAYSGGGIGAYLIINIGTACLLSTNNTLISSTLGVDPTHMYILYVIAVLANIPLTAIRANIIDNTRSKAGKYRPYIVRMAIPTAIISMLMVWFPYDKLEVIFGSGKVFGETYAYIAKCALILLFNLFLHFFYYFFYDAYENLIHVMSPNTQERADVASVKSVVYSFGPTIVQLVTPLIAANVFHSNTTDIRVYRLVYPILTILGILLCIVVYKNTEERIVQARTHVVQIKFIDALKAVAKNKYFWLINFYSVLSGLKYGIGSILAWYCVYQIQNEKMLGIMNTVIGTASVPLMLLAPVLAKKIGKRNILVWTNLLRAVLSALMLFTMDSTVVFFACLYLATLMIGGDAVVTSSMTAEIFDYQQWKTGVRLEGFITQFGAMITTVAGMFTNLILPYFYEHYGLKDDYTVLYDASVRTPIFNILIITTIISCVICVVPMFFYNLKEKDHKKIIEELKERAGTQGGELI